MACLDNSFHVSLGRVNVVQGDEELGRAHGPALTAGGHAQQAVEHLTGSTQFSSTHYW